MPTPTPQRPSLGRVVHYSRPSGGPVFVGIVVGCRDFVTDLYLLPNCPGMDAMVLQCVAHGTGPGYWQWPEVIEPAPDLRPDTVTPLDRIMKEVAAEERAAPRSKPKKRSKKRAAK